MLENKDRLPVSHELKTDPEVFDAVQARLKTFEIRKDDRKPKYAVGDTLILRRTERTGAEMAAGAPLVYSDTAWGPCCCLVKYILHGPIYGLEAGWVIMSVEVLEGVGG